MIFEQVEGKRINKLRYADDIVPMTKSEKDLQSLLNKVNDSEEPGLRININKTKVMVVTSTIRIFISIAMTSQYN